MVSPGKETSVSSYRLFSLLAIVSFGGLLSFLLVDRELVVQVLGFGGVDIYGRRLALIYIPVLLTSAGAFVIFKSSFMALEREIMAHEAARQQYLAELEHSYQSVMIALVAALDSRDHLAKGHSCRVVAYALAIADRLELSPDERRDLTFGGYLHDVGKIGLDDSLLRKKSPLSEDEWAEMRRHPAIGLEILEEVDFLGGASDVILHHHEHYDGQGYPMGLAGAEIPLLARIFAVADAFDAMTADRPYRRAMSFAEAREAIAIESSLQFCPMCVYAFLSYSDKELHEIRVSAGERRREGAPREARPGVKDPPVARSTFAKSR